jgi:hypothetical protein
VIKGQTYLHAEDMRKLLHNPDVIYTFGCLLKVHVENPHGPFERGWSGAVKVIAADFLRLSLGEVEMITQPQEGLN